MTAVIRRLYGTIVAKKSGFVKRNDGISEKVLPCRQEEGNIRWIQECYFEGKVANKYEKYNQE